MSKGAQDVSTPPLSELLTAIPPPLTIVLIGLGPIISHLVYVLKVVSWKTSWEESWLALAIWWAICLFSDVTLRYLLPAVLLSVYIYTCMWKPTTSAEPLPVTDQNLHHIITDLTTIRALLPSISLKLPQKTLDLYTLLRIAGIIYLPYLILTYTIRLRILLAITGTVIFTWRSRWGGLVRYSLWRSAYIRWGTYHAWSRISGLPLPLEMSTISAAPSALTVPSTSQSSQTIRFLFTLYENQRWWMGLDWTAALLPGERPSWCTGNQQPVSPPEIFSLPSPTTVYSPDPVKPGHRIKRVATWHWEEPEWRVMVRKEGGSVTRVERPLPSLNEESSSSSAGRILKAAGKMRQASIGGEGSSPERMREKEKEDLQGRGGDSQDETEETELYTDVDGWVYADNKWESASAKGGMGKYTRYRRWTRVAVLVETVEEAEPGEVGIWREGANSVNSQPASTAAAQEKAVTASAAPQPSVGDSVAEQERARLRQRLKTAIHHTS